MSWQIGVSTGSFYPFQTMEQAIHSIGKAGFWLAELFIQTPSEYTIVYGRRISREMLASGVRIHSIHLNNRDLDVFAPYKPRRQDADGLFRRSLEMAYTIGAQVINWHGASQKEIQKGLDNDWMWDTVARWQEWAEEAAITLTVENISWCMLRTPEDVLEAQRQIPDLYFTFDSFQAAESQVSPVALASAMGRRIATVHLSDYDSQKTRHLIPGEGTIDWAPLLLKLADLQYSGPLIIELSNLNDQNYLSALIRSRKFLEKAVREQGLKIRQI